MLSNRRFLFSFMIIIVVVVRFGETLTSCIPNQLILLSNCSFDYPISSSHLTTNDNRTLSMIVPYPLHTDDDEHLLITVFLSKQSFKPLIRFNLRMIQCSMSKTSFNWTAVESSSTLRGEFVRTNHIEKNTMYLPTGRTYLTNLTTIDCRTKTIYQTDHRQLFELDLKIESTLNDYCTNDYSCYPRETYQCNQPANRCQCRKSFQSYLIAEQYPICLQAVQTIDQCTTDRRRCLQWCHRNSSSTMCLCPKDISRKKFSDNDHNRAYCESRTGGICNAFLQCPFDNLCLRGICQHRNQPSNMLTTSILISCLVLLMISILLGICIYILRCQRWKKHYQPPMTSKREEIIAPNMCDYDNVTYEIFRQHGQLASSEEKESSPMTSSDDGSYEPKIVYLGGEQQLTAIFA